MILTAPWVLPIASPAIRNGAVALENGTILAVGPSRAILRAFPHHARVHLEGHAILPGLVNTHTHLELSALSGLYREARDFVDWILKLIARKRALTTRKRRQAMASAARMLIRTGTTTVADVATDIESAAILRSMGIRAYIYLEIIGLDDKNTKEKLNHVLSKLKILVEQTNATSCIYAGLSPHAPYSVSKNLLEEISKTIRRNNFNLCMHLLENKDENKNINSKSSRFFEYFRRVGWAGMKLAYAPGKLLENLDRLGLLSSRMLAVHGVHASARDIRLLARRNVAVAHCPRSNAYLKVGKAPLSRMLDAGLRVGLGTDSLASNDSLSLWDELRAAQKLHPGLLTPRQWLTLATLGGARALGLADRIGTLEPGKRADLIAVAVDSRNPPYAKILADTQEVGLAMVNGNAVHHPTFPALKGRVA